MYVDRQFTNLLGEIFGNDFINKFKQAHPDGWLELMTSFETVKKPFDGQANKSLRVKLPWSFGDFHGECKDGKSIKNSIQMFKNHDVAFINGTLVLKNEIVNGLFNTLIGKIISHVDMLLQKPVLEHIKFIFMVGGFSESQLLQNRVKEQFEKNGITILIPAEAQLAVLKGAVLYGHFPVEIGTRIARKTYGYGSHERYNPKQHSLSRTYVDKEDGSRWCRHIFNILVKQGDPIPAGKTISTSAWPTLSRSTKSITNIYAIDGEPNFPIQYTDETDVECIGKVVTTLPPCQNKKENALTKEFIFGSTEIHVKVTHDATGKEFITAVDFLSESSIKA